MATTLSFLPQDSNLTIRKIQGITEVTQDGPVLVPDPGHLLETEVESPRISKVGNVGEGPEMGTKVTEKANHLKENHMVAGQEVNHNMTAGHVPPPTHGVIDMRKLQQGRPHHTASQFEEMVNHHLYRGVTYVAEVGHRTGKRFVAHHVIGRPHHSLAGMAPEVANNKHSNAGTTAQEHALILKDVRAMLSNGVADLRTGKELLVTRVGRPAETHQDSAHTAVDQTAEWHNVASLRNMNFLIGDVNYAPLCSCIGLQLTINLLRIQGPPKQ
jgi:hypothetical protein